MHIFNVQDKFRYMNLWSFFVLWSSDGTKQRTISQKLKGDISKNKDILMKKRHTPKIMKERDKTKPLK